MQYESKTLNHLGLVAGMIDRIGVVEVIDRLVSRKNAQGHISNGICIKALILNGLGFFERRLYLTSSFFSGLPVERLLGADVKAEYLNDDRLGRCLDSLYEFGLSDLFVQISREALDRLGIASAKGLHLDSTSLHVDGVYNSQLSDEAAEYEDAVLITQGYSRDHRPDLNQVVINMIVDNATSLPLFMKAVDGNASDKQSFLSQIQQAVKHLKCPEESHFIADSALYSAHNITALSPLVKWLTRVPVTINEASAIADTTPPDALCSFYDSSLKAYKYLQVCSAYGGVKQQWLLVFSQAAYEREIVTHVRNYCNKSLKESELFSTMQRKIFNCEADARTALNSFVAKLKYCCLHQPAIEPVMGYHRKGRPAKDKKPEITGYIITGTVGCNLQAWRASCQNKGRFILASNDLNMAPFQMLTNYKGQAKVEKGFRFMKDKQFLASTMFVKKPQRVEAVCFLLTLSLLVYTSLEHILRNELARKQQDVPDQKNKPTQKPTMRWVFALFSGIQCLDQSQDMRFIAVLNRKQHHHTVIDALGEECQKYYRDP